MRTLFSTCVWLALGTAPAFASGIPDPTKSTTDRILVGNSSGADMGNAYHVTLRNIGNIPIPGKLVTIYFLASGARADINQESGTTVDCANDRLIRTSDTNGEVVFHAAFAGYNNDHTVQIRGNGVLLNTVPVRSTDLNADGATDLRDLNAFRERFVHDTTASETDFNQDGVTNGYDFELMRAEFVRGVKNEVCP